MCLLMIAAVAVSTVSADEAKIDARELLQYGQVHYYLGNAVAPTAAPNVRDGKVNEGEYATSYKFDLSNPDLTKFYVDSSKTNGFIEAEWVEVHMSHDGEKLYVAMVAKDNVFVAGKDKYMLLMNLKDNGTTGATVSRLRYDFTGDPKNGVLVDEAVGATITKQIKSDDGSEWVSATYPDPVVADHIKGCSLNYDTTNKLFIVEIAFDIKTIANYWGNTNAVADLRAYFSFMFDCYGNSVEGANDYLTEPLMQGRVNGMMKNKTGTEANLDLQFRFEVDYPAVPYKPDFFPHIIYFCEEPEPTEPPVTEAPTTEAPTTAAPTTEAPTTKAPTTVAPTTKAPATEAPTTAAEDKGCNNTIALSALAVVPMMAAAVVFGKKKED